MLHRRGELKTDFKPLCRIDGTLLYHAPCQQKAHHMGQPALDLFELIPGLACRTQPTRPAAASPGRMATRPRSTTSPCAWASRCSSRCAEFGSDQPVICDSETCRWQITHATGAPSIHPVQALAAAYGLMPLDLE